MYHWLHVDLKVNNAFFSKQQYALLPYIDYQYAHLTKLRVNNYT